MKCLTLSGQLRESRRPVAIFLHLQPHVITTEVSTPLLLLPPVMKEVDHHTMDRYRVEVTTAMTTLITDRHLDLIIICIEV